jgi:hypothetical protein
MHAVITLLPSPDTVLLGQLSHVAAAVAATAVEYVCTPQLVHAAGPGATLYLPAAQLEHALSHTVVRSIPCFMASAIEVIAPMLMYSSTTNTPAISP